MVGFLAPAALFGLVLLSIPTLLHLFKPRKVRQTPFSSLRWLRASQHRLSRRMQWHQILLFIARASLVALLVFALSKPYISVESTPGSTDRFLVLDTSRTMAYRGAQDTTPLDAGKAVVQQLISEMSEGDRATIVLAGSKPKALGPLTRDPSRYLPRMRSAPVEAADADLTSALRLVAPLLGSAQGSSPVEVVFVTDHYAQKWSEAAIRRFVGSLPGPTSIKVVDVAPSIVENTWIRDARLIETQRPHRRTIRVELASSGHVAEEQTVQLSDLPKLSTASKKVRIRPGVATHVEFELPPEYDLQGKVARLQIQPEDRLRSDDTFWLNLDSTGASNVLVIEPPSARPQELHAGFHLRTALESLSSANPGTLRIVHQPHSGVLAGEIARADVIMLVDVPQLSDGNFQALEQRVKSGAGLVVFLGPTVEPTFYNTKVLDSLRPGQSLLPAILSDRIRVRPDTARLPRIAQLEWSHPLLDQLADPIYSDLAQVSFTSYYQLQARPSGGVLARIAEGPPAIVEQPLGAGKVVLCNFTANDEWSDLPRRKCFVPLIDRLIRYVGQGPGRGSFTIGQRVVMPLRTSHESVLPSVITPAGKTTTAQTRMVAGRAMVDLEDLSEPGVYRVEFDEGGTRKSFPFVVQSGRTHSALVRSDSEVLRAWWKPASFDATKLDESGRISLRRPRMLLETWLIAAACLALLAEMFLVHWLCPSVNPTVKTGSTIFKRAIFASRDDDGPMANGAAPAQREPAVSE